MFVTHIAEASVDGNGKGLVDNGGIDGCRWSEREWEEGGRVPDDRGRYCLDEIVIKKDFEKPRNLPASWRE